MYTITQTELQHTEDYYLLDKYVLIPEIFKHRVLQCRSCSDSRRRVHIQQFVQKVVNIIRNSVPSPGVRFCAVITHAAPFLRSADGLRFFNVRRVTRRPELCRQRVVPTVPHASQSLAQNPQVESGKLAATHHRLACRTSDQIDKIRRFGTKIL